MILIYFFLIFPFLGEATSSSPKNPFVVVAVWSTQPTLFPKQSAYKSAIGVYLNKKSVKSGKSDCIAFDTKRSGKLNIKCGTVTATSVYDYRGGIVGAINIKHGKLLLPVVSRFPFFLGAKAMALPNNFSLVNVWAPAYLDSTLEIPPLIQDKQVSFPVYTTGRALIGNNNIPIKLKNRYIARYDSLYAYCNSIPSKLMYTSFKFKGIWGNSKNNININIVKGKSKLCTGAEYVASSVSITIKEKRVKVHVDCSTDVIGNSYVIDNYSSPYFSEYVFYTGNAKPLCKYLGSGTLKVKNPYEVTVSNNYVQPFGEYVVVLYTLYTNAADFKNRKPALYAFYPLYGRESAFSCGKNAGISMSYKKYTFEFGGSKNCHSGLSYANIMGKVYKISDFGPTTTPEKTAGAVVQAVPYTEMQLQGGNSYCLLPPGKFSCICSYCL